MYRSNPPISLFLLALFLMPTFAHANENNALNSTIRLFIYDENNVEVAQGAGVIVGSDQFNIFFVTAAHVVFGTNPKPGQTRVVRAEFRWRRGDQVEVRTPREQPDPRFDLAVGMIGKAKAGSRYSADRLPDYRILRDRETYEEVVAVGSGNGKLWKASAKTRIEEIRTLDLVIVNNGNIAPGDSGGAIFDTSYNLIGITKSVEGHHAFATPINFVQRELNRLGYEFDLDESRQSLKFPRRTPNPAPPQSSRQHVVAYVGVDFEGADLASLRRETVRSCAEGCKSQITKGCRAFTYIHPRVFSKPTTPNCYLKFGNGAPVANPDAVSGLLADERSVHASRLTGTKFSTIDYGLDYKAGWETTISARTQQSCKRSCAVDSNCRAYVYAGWFSSLKRCWLKFGRLNPIGGDPRLQSARKVNTIFVPSDLDQLR